MKTVLVSLRVRTRSSGLTSRLTLKKKGVSDGAVNSIIKEVKTLSNPKSFAKGKDRGQIIVKVEGKPVFVQKFVRIKASFNLFTPSITEDIVKTAKPAVTKKAVVKKPVVVKKSVTKK